MRRPNKVNGRLACQNCSDRKKACFWPRGTKPEDPCSRCSKSNLVCTAQDLTESRRRRQERRNPATTSNNEVNGQDEEPGAVVAAEGAADDVAQMSATTTAKSRRTYSLRPPKPEPQEPEPQQTPPPPPAPPQTNEQRTKSRLEELAAIADSPEAALSDSRTVPFSSLPLPLPQELSQSILFSRSATEDPEVLVLAVAAYWSHVHFSFPMVHRATFESAWNGGQQGSAIYGPNRPVALYYTLATSGLAFLELPHLTDAYKAHLCREWTAMARDHLAANYFSQNRTVTDLEAAQTLVILYLRLVSFLLIPRAFMYLERAIEIVPRLIQDPLNSGSFIGLGVPTDHIDWIRSEMILRLFIVAGAHDQGYAYLTQGFPSMHLFFRIGLPCHETYFDNPSSAEAFDLLRKAHTAAGPTTPFWTQVDLSIVLRPDPDPQLARMLVRALIRPIFAQLASTLSALYLLAMLRQMRIRVRDFASANGIDPIRLASSSPEFDSPASKLFRQHVGTLQVMINEMTSSLPEPIAQAMAAGDAGPLLQLGNTTLGHPGHAHCLLGAFLAGHALAVESWMPDSPADPDLAFFSSGTFETVIESGVLAAHLMEGQLAVDPRLRWHLQWSFIPSMRVGGLLAASVRTCSRSMRILGPEAAEANEAARRAAKIIGKWVDIIGWYHKPLGHQMADNFQKLMVDAGIEPDDAPDNPAARARRGSDARPAPMPEMPTSFSETVHAVDKWEHAWNQLQDERRFMGSTSQG